MSTILLASAALCWQSPAPARSAAQDQPPAEVELVPGGKLPATMTASDARPGLSAALGYLLSTQHPDGSWATATPTMMELGFAPETFYDWKYASCLLAVLALMECEPTPERERALERGLEWCCTTRMTIRGDDWDNDQMWTALYGTVALTRAARDPRFSGAAWQEKIAARGADFVHVLVHNQVPEGGWGYYDDPPFTQRPKWGTSFSTACALPAVRDARALGWIESDQVVDRARRYVERCRVPGGAFEYDLNPIPRLRGVEHINLIQGSLGRTQVCHWALASLGVEWVTSQRIRDGLEAFFREHRYLDVARMRPIPHEAYFANAGYFYFFGHYYAALAIELLPQAEREAFHARLRPHLVKALRPDGSVSDFLNADYDTVASTAFLAMALDLGMAKDP